MPGNLSRRSVRSATRSTAACAEGRPDGENLLANQLAADPIDGFMLFPFVKPRQGMWRGVAPRTAHILALAAELLADVCHDLIIPAGEAPDDEHLETVLRDLVHGWDSGRIHQLGAISSSPTWGRPTC